MDKLDIGDRVVVRIPDKSRYAVGAAESLDGKRGTVEEINPRTGDVLVRFDEPASPWWGSQTPPSAWWFESRELESISVKSNPLICRYSDCAGGHPTTNDDNEQITCPTCRKWMGLPTIEGST